ncbi:MAG: hypothetical protein ACK6DZ_21505 [Acidobacteriota bacterium]
MNLKFWRHYAGQLAGQAVLGGLLWYWLGLGLASPLLVAANGILLLLMVFGCSLLIAYGLGQWRNWMWAMPAALSISALFFDPIMAIVLPLVWIGVFMPSAAARRWRICLDPATWAWSCAWLLLAVVVPVGLWNWVPRLSGLGLELGSFLLRAGLGYAVWIGGWTMLLRQISGGTTVSQARQ